MTEQTKSKTLLVLHGPALASQGILELLSGRFEVQVVRQMEEALQAMRSRPFDAVLAETADFLPLERGVVTQRASVVLDTLGDGVGIVGPQGQLVWTNRRLREFPPPVLNMLADVCRKAFDQFSQDSAQGDRGRRFSFLPEDGSYFELVCSPIRDHGGQLQQIAVVVIDATQQRRQQIKLNAIDRAGRELVSLHHDATARDASKRLQLLEERIIRYSRDVLNYQHFSILLLDAKSNRLEPLICEGLDKGLPGEGDLPAGTDSGGICGYVAATGQTYITHDARTDSRYIPSFDGARSTLTVPLRLHDKVIGVLNVESDRIGAFGDEDRQFAEIFANYIAIALEILNLLVAERHSTQTQVSGSLSAELAGPLNDIVAMAAELMEDYIGHDDLRKRLGHIVDAAMNARKATQAMVDAPRTGVLGVPQGPPAVDSVLAGKRVLVADDEELMRQTVAHVLGRYGCEVDVAVDGNAAIARIQLCRYDLIISDIKMPGATGYQVFSAAKAVDARTKVILMTAFGYDPHHSIVRANREGLSAVLMKPFKAGQLLDECRAALSK